MTIDKPCSGSSSAILACAVGKAFGRVNFPLVWSVIYIGHICGQKIPSWTSSDNAAGCDNLRLSRQNMSLGHV